MSKFKKIFSFFLAIISLLNLCLMSAVYSQETISENVVVADDKAFKWESYYTPSNYSISRKLFSLNDFDNVEVKSVSCEKANDKELLWTLYIDDMKLIRLTNQGVGIDIQGDIKGVIHDIQYKGINVYPPSSKKKDEVVNININKPHNLFNHNTILSGLTNGDVTIKNPVITFKTSRDIKKLGLRISLLNSFLAFEKQKYGEIDFNVEKTSDVQNLSFGIFSRSGSDSDIKADKLKVTITGNDSFNSSYDFYIDRKDHFSTSSIYLKTGDYNVSVSSPDSKYNLAPKKFSISVKNGGIYSKDVYISKLKSLDSNGNTVYRAFIEEENIDTNPVDPDKDIPIKINYLNDDGDSSPQAVYPEHFSEESKSYMGNPGIDKGKNYVRNYSNKQQDSYMNSSYIEYSDSVLGKEAKATDSRGFFDITLSVKGRPNNDTDVVFAVDNSHSLFNDFSNKIINGASRKPRENYMLTKIYSMNKNLKNFVDSILDKNGNRVGIVNFSTLSFPLFSGDESVFFENMKEFDSGIMGSEDIDSIIYAMTGFSKFKQSDFFAIYNKYFESSLTNNKDLVKKSIPYRPRGFSFDTAYGYNVGLRQDGLKNIVAGMNRGTEFLYADSPGRKKILVLLTDGLPTASYRIDSTPLDYSQPLVSNINFYPDITYYTENPDIYSRMNSLGKRQSVIDSTLVATGTVNFDKNSISQNSVNYPFYSYTKNGSGTYIMDNHLDPTYYLSEYLKKERGNMRVVSVLIGNDNKSQNSGYIKSLSSGGSYDFFSAGSDDELKKSFDKIKKSIENSITNGKVTDPMGDNVQLFTGDGDEFTPISPVNGNIDFSQGGFFLRDNNGNYMGADGVIYDKSGRKSDSSNLEGIKVDFERSGSGKIVISGLNLGNNEEIKLTYRVKLKKENAFFQANGKTTLVTGSSSQSKVRDFPIPSVKVIPPPPSELPSTGGISFGMKSGMFVVSALLICYLIYANNIKKMKSDL